MFIPVSYHIGLNKTITRKKNWNYTIYNIYISSVKYNTITNLHYYHNIDGIRPIIEYDQIIQSCRGKSYKIRNGKIPEWLSEHITLKIKEAKVILKNELNMYLKMFQMSYQSM